MAINKTLAKAHQKTAEKNTKEKKKIHR